MFALIGILLILSGVERISTGDGLNVITGFYAILAGVVAGVAGIIA
jgi:hypothetical protein